MSLSKREPGYTALVLFWITINDHAYSQICHSILRKLCRLWRTSLPPFATLRYWWRWKQFLDWQSFGSVGLSPNFVVAIAVVEGGSKAKSSEKNSPWGFENSPTTRYIVQLLFIINHIVCSTYIAQQKTVTLFGIKWNPALFIVISAANSL